MGLLGDSGGPEPGKWFKKAIKLSDQFISDLPGVLGPAYANEAKRGALLREGFDTARGDLNRAGRGTEQFIHDNQAQMGSAIQQQMVSSGMQNTTMLGNSFRGVASDADRRMTELNSTLAGMFADLDVKEGAALAANTGQTAAAQIQAHLASKMLLQQGAISLGGVSKKGTGIAGFIEGGLSDFGALFGDLGAGSVGGTPTPAPA